MHLPQAAQVSPYNSTHCSSEPHRCVPHPPHGIIVASTAFVPLCCTKRGAKLVDLAASRIRVALPLTSGARVDAMGIRAPHLPPLAATRKSCLCEGTSGNDTQSAAATSRSRPFRHRSLRADDPVHLRRDLRGWDLRP